MPFLVKSSLGVDLCQLLDTRKGSAALCQALMQEVSSLTFRAENIMFLYSAVDDRGIFSLQLL